MYWSKPWICPGYSKKHTNLMAEMELTMHRGSVGMWPTPAPSLVWYFLLFLWNAQYWCRSIFINLKESLKNITLIFYNFITLIKYVLWRYTDYFFLDIFGTDTLSNIWDEIYRSSLGFKKMMSIRKMMTFVHTWLVYLGTRKKKVFFS